MKSAQWWKDRRDREESLARRKEVHDRSGTALRVAADDDASTR